MLSFTSAFDFKDGTIVSYYKLDNDNLNDYFNLNNLANTGTTNVSGLIGSARNVENNQYMSKTTPSGLVTGAGDRTACMWIYPTNLTDARVFFGYGGAGESKDFILLTLSDSKVRFTFSGTDIDSTTTLSTETWYYICGVQDSGTQRLYINAEANGTATVTLDTEVSTLFIGTSNTDQSLEFRGRIDEVGYWNRTLTPSEISELYNSGTGLPISTVVLSLNSPDNNSIEIINDDIIFNITTIETNASLSLLNITLYIDGVLNETKSLSGTSDTETFTKQFPTIGNRSWYATSCNNINECENSTTRNIVVNFFKVNSITHNDTTFETAEETFIVNVSGVLSSVVLFHNGTEYATTKSGELYTTTLQVPVSTGNKSIHWRFNDLNNSQTVFQNVSETVFTLCNATYTTRFLNISFKDEADSSVINASIPTSTFQYYLGDGTVNKTYDFINISNNFYYEFCATPNRTLNVASFFQYKQGTEYPQRVIDSPAVEYTNTTTNTTLYLLATADGLFVTFQVINSAEQTISGVFMTAIREISGQDQTVGVGTTAASGSVTLWLNPDFVHDFVFSKAGLPGFSTSFAPTQASYTIIMGTGNTAQNSTIRGIDYSILPRDNFLENDTVYTFGFNLTSSFWDVTEYGFNLRLANGTIITGGTSSVSGTPLTISYNVTNQSIIYIDAYWLINGNFTNITQTWSVQNTAYTGWSIKTFFTDLTTYLDSGLFGLDNFGRYLIAFIIIFTSVGIMGQKFGITSPLGITSLMFGIVLFFDVVTGVLPDIRGISNLPTFLAGLILAISVLNEVQSR